MFLKESQEEVNFFKKVNILLFEIFYETNLDNITLNDKDIILVIGDKFYLFEEIQYL